MHKRTIILTATILTLVCYSTPAVTYFVATDGNDTNPGTEAKPFEEQPTGSVRSNQ